MVWYGVGGVACVGARLARAAKAGTNSLAFAINDQCYLKGTMISNHINDILTLL